MTGTTIPPDDDDFGGLHRDLRLLDRRRALQLAGGVTLTGLLAAACGSSRGSNATGTPSSTTAGATETGMDASAGAEIPSETQGPYPADGSNGPNVLTDGAVVRSDLTTSFGDLSGTAEGIPTSVQLTIVDAGTGDPLPGAAVYLWHCTAAGRYSIYEIADQNYLRGVQVADDSGRLTFTTVFPGCYAGRWPHMHFEVYDSLEVASSGSNARKTSQLAIPQADCEIAYADDRYGNSAGNLARLSLNTDNVFADGWSDQLATVAGSPDDGYTMSLLVRT